MRNLLICMFSVVALFSLFACPDEEQLRPEREQLQQPAQEQKDDINDKQIEQKPMQQQPPPAGENY